MSFGWGTNLTNDFRGCAPFPGTGIEPISLVCKVISANGRPEVIREADMWGATMLDQLACRISYRRLRYDGPFTTPSLKGSIVFPGNLGVMDWGGMAIDPVRQIAYAHTNYMAFVDRLVAQPDAGRGKPVG